MGNSASTMATNEFDSIPAGPSTASIRVMDPNDIPNGSWKIPTTESTLNLLKHYFEIYRGYVKQNPILISEIESGIYWVSYLLSTTRFHNSRIVSELLYSCSSLLTMFNDNLLRKSYKIRINNNVNVKSFHTILTFVEYLQVFLELTAVQLYGTYGKWIVISIIELVKATIRLVLLFYFQEGLTRRQYLNPLNRQREYENYKMKLLGTTAAESNIVDITKSSLPEPNNEDDYESGLGSDEAESVSDSQSELERNSFQLKSSGRVIRTIESAPPKSQRMWITPIQTIRLRRLLKKHNSSNPAVTHLDRRRVLGECLHIIRPIAHLTASAFSGGVDKWSPYLLSFTLDIASLRLLSNNSGSKLSFGFGGGGSGSTTGSDVLKIINEDQSIDCVWNWSEQIEIQKRYLSLFIYLLRSPFYDRYTKQRLLRVLSFFANNIPLFGRLVVPFIGYLPEWQRCYYYVWNH